MQIDETPRVSEALRATPPTDAATSDRRAFSLRVYALVGDLLVRGPRTTGFEPVRALLDSGRRTMDLDEAEHEPESYRELDLQGRTFLGADSATLRAAHTALGLPLPTDPGADHLGQSLRLMATLLDAEFEAATHGDHEEVATLRRWQTRVLDDVLLPWMPPLLAALAGQPPTLWTHALEMAARTLASHRATDPALPEEVGGGELVFLHERPDDLTALVELLSTPRCCGVVLSRRDLASVARRCELPPELGGHGDLLEPMLAHAIEHGRLPRLAAELAQLFAAREDVLASLAELPGLAAHVPAWQRRLARSRALLERLSSTDEQLRGAS